MTIGVVARAVEQRFDVTFDERERRAQFMADVGDKFLAGAFELLEPGQIVKDENRAFAFAGGVGDGGGVDLQPALAQLRQLQFVIENLAVAFDPLDQRGEFMHAQGFHDGFAAQLGFQAEKIFECAIGEINPAVAVEQQQALQHAVEQDLLLRLGVNRRLLVPPLQLFHLGPHLPPLVEKFLPPPEVNRHGHSQSEDGKDRPHNIYLATDETRMKHRFFQKKPAQRFFFIYVSSVFNPWLIIPQTGTRHRGRCPDALMRDRAFRGGGACACPPCACQ